MVLRALVHLESCPGRFAAFVLEYALGRREATGSVGEDLAQALADLGAADPTRARGYKWASSQTTEEAQITLQRPEALGLLPDVPRAVLRELELEWLGGAERSAAYAALGRGLTLRGRVDAW